MASDLRNVHFRFLELPRELRDHIYGFAFEQIRSNLHAEPCEIGFLHENGQFGYYPEAGLMACCRQIRAECLTNIFKGFKLHLDLDAGMAPDFCLPWLKVNGRTVVPVLRAIVIRGWRTHNRKKCSGTCAVDCECTITIGLNTDLEPFTFAYKQCFCPDHENSFEQAEKFVRALETKSGRRHLTLPKLRRLLKILTRPWNFNTGRTYENRMNFLGDQYLRVRRLERLGKSKRLIARHKQKILIALRDVQAGIQLGYAPSSSSDPS